MRQPKFTVVGAGIGGLSCAIALQDAGCEVQVYERAPELRAVGAGICMWPNGARALRALGVGPALDTVSPILGKLEYRDMHGRRLRTFSVTAFTERVQHRSYPLARADLHEALLARLGDERVTLDAECLGVEQDPHGVRATLSGSRTVESDYLIGADGYQSVVRAGVLEPEQPLNYYYSSWVGLAPGDLELTPADTFTFLVGDDKRAGILNVGHNRHYFFCDAPIERTGSDLPGNPAVLLKELFDGWGGPIPTLLENIDPDRTPCLPVYDFDPLESFVYGRIVLAGDAAHATTPTLGQGGALALEDAVVLGRRFASSEPAEALAAYDAERRPRTARVVLTARARTVGMLSLKPGARDNWSRGLSEPGRTDFLDELEEIAASGPIR